MAAEEAAAAEAILRGACMLLLAAAVEECGVGRVGARVWRTIARDTV